MRYWIITALSLIAFINNPVYAFSCKSQRCLAVVDSGSTGSRLHVYTYDVKENDPINIQEIYANTTQPGLSNIQLSPTTINKYLDQLFSITPDENIPVYFYSTAGMRLLSQQKQQAYYDTLKQWFETHSRWELKNAKTITGNEEALYGWLAVNYDQNTLTPADTPLLGVMDTGGASVQITFPITNTQAINPSDLIEFDLYGRHIQLFAHSFLGLGQNELDHQFLDTADCFPYNYVLSSGEIAHGSFSNCKDQTTTLINNIHHVDAVVKPILQSNPVKSWYAIGALNHLIHTKPFSFHTNEFTLDNLADQSDQAICHKTWAELNTQDPTNDYLYSACLNASYFYALLVNGYGLNPNQPINYYPNVKNEVSWTLGVVLHHQ